MSDEEVVRRFSFHSPDTSHKVICRENIQRQYLSLARTLNNILPEGRLKAIAFTELEASMMWADKAISMEVDNGSH